VVRRLKSITAHGQNDPANINSPVSAGMVYVDVQLEMSYSVLGVSRFNVHSNSHHSALYV